MNERWTNEIELEPERYELAADPVYQFELGEMQRRDFFKVLAKAGGGVLIVLALKDALAQQESGRGGRRGGAPRPVEIGAWLHIAENGVVTAYTGKAEVGQNIRTSLTQAVAEELRAPISSIKIVMGDTDLTPFDQGTFGSRTTPDMFPQLRKAAAAAREIMLDLAAEQLKVERGALLAADGKVTHSATKQSLSYGQLSKGQKLMKAIGEASLTPSTEWRVASKPLRKVNGRDIVTGKHQFTPDIKLPGMLHGKVLRPSAFGATLASIDARGAESLPGVTVAKAFGWGKSSPAANHGFGIAGGFEKAGYVANCAEVAVDRASGKVKLVRVVTAFECGAIVNPDGLKNQVEGSVIQGIGGALFEAIDFADGKILNPRFSRYRVPRFSDTPKLETVLLDRKDLPSAGAGECPIVGLAPAVGNAIFNATGIRLRSLPMVPNGLKA